MYVFNICNDIAHTGWSRKIDYFVVNSNFCEPPCITMATMVN